MSLEVYRTHLDQFDLTVAEKDELIESLQILIEHIIGDLFERGLTNHDN